jgi:hypothetical protein
MRKGSSWRMSKAGRSPSLRINTANKYIDDHPESIAFATEQYRSLVASGRLRPPRKLKLCSTICTATEALSCKGFRCANIVNEMKRKAMRGPKSLCMMEVKQ